MSKKNLYKEKYPREYRIWKAMKARCYSTSANKGNYKENHIEVCEEWKNSFYNFITDMGACPDGYSIDRINNLGNYCKNNCRWADNATQAKNKSNNLLYNINGKQMCLKDIAKEYNIKYTTLYNRIFKYNFSIEDAISDNFEEIRRIKNQYSSKYNGVSYRKTYKKWRAYIKENDKQISLGYFDTEEEAYSALNNYELRRK